MACNLLYGPQESAAKLNVLAPDIHEMGGKLGDGSYAGLVKTHFAYSSALPYAQRTAAAIYVVRNPSDVLASNFHYAQRSAGAHADSTEAFDRYFDTFVENRGDPRWIGLGMGSWEGNVRSWLGTPHPFPVVQIRYEDLSTDPVGVCRTLAQGLKPNSSSDEIQRAVEGSSFRRMREIEDGDIREKRVGIFYKPYLQASIDSGRRFMRRGGVGEGASRLTPDQRVRLTAAFGPLMAQLGYLTT